MDFWYTAITMYTVPGDTCSKLCIYLPEFLLQGALHEAVCLVHHQIGDSVQMEGSLLIEV